MNNENYLIKVDKNAHLRVRQQSLYIAALDRYRNIRGLIYPYQDSEGYQFDFHAPGARRLIKVFTEINEAEIERYSNYSKQKNIIFIIDLTGLVKRPVVAMLNRTIPQRVLESASKLGALLFAEEELYSSVQLSDGSIGWAPCPEPYDIGREDGYKKGYQEGRIDQIVKIECHHRNAA